MLEPAPATTHLAVMTRPVYYGWGEDPEARLPANGKLGNSELTAHSQIPTSEAQRARYRETHHNFSVSRLLHKRSGLSHIRAPRSVITLYG